MLINANVLKIIMVLLFVYSSGTTVFLVRNNYSDSSSEEVKRLSAEITQLNTQINSLKIELDNEKKDNEDLAAIREIMEKDKAAREEATRKHKEKPTRDPFEGLEEFDGIPIYEW